MSATIREALEKFRRLLDRLDYDQAADLYDVPVEALAALDRLVAAEAQRDTLAEALQEIVRREGYSFTSWDYATLARAALAAATPTGGESGVSAGASDTRGSSKPRSLVPLCDECGKEKESHNGEWWCPDDWAFEQAWDAFYWNRRDPSLPLEDR